MLLHINNPKPVPLNDFNANFSNNLGNISGSISVSLSFILTWATSCPPPSLFSIFIDTIASYRLMNLRALLNKLATS
jgi:hypothetical protein